MLLAILFCDEFFQKKSFFVQAKLTLNQIYSYLISAYFALGQGCPTFWWTGRSDLTFGETGRCENDF